MNNQIYFYKKSEQKIIRSIVPVLLLIFYLLPLGSNAQTTTENYIKSTEYLTENGEGGDKKISIMYLDGLGREKQAVQVAATPQGKDILTHFEYDGFGRQVKDYLPVPSNSSQGAIVTDPLSLYNQYYGDAQTYNTQYYYSEKELENSPLNRMIKQAAPGDSWRLGGEHEIKIQYQSNTTNEVRLFKVSLATGYVPSLVDGGYYKANQLYKTLTFNENWQPSDGKNNTTEDFKNKQDKTILKRNYNNGLAHDTYYIYDIYGNLTYVLPPMLSDKPIINQALLDDLGYQYKYDERNRLVEKKIPGKGWEYIVYDKQDRVVLTQDANQKSKQWNFTKYDKFGRVVYSGLFANTASRASMQTALNSMAANPGNNEEKSTSPFTLNNINVYYTKKAFPTGSMTILNINYYDNYENTNTPLVSSIEGQEVLQGNGQELKGLMTASFAAIIGDAQGKGNWTYKLYDQKSRPIRILTQNYLGGFTQTDTKLNYFRGRTEYILTQHKRSSEKGGIITVKQSFTYDNQERLLTHTHQINGDPIEYLTQNAYDELGQLKNKKVGGLIQSQGLQQVDYKYNIRGWLTDINNLDNLTQPNQPQDLFAFRISYDKMEFQASGFTPLFNGNISETFWKTSTDNQKRQYSYQYDHLNRLKKGLYIKNYNPSNGSFSVGNAYDEDLNYDKNGNITHLGRTGDQDVSNNVIGIDDLDYTYKTNSNQLLAVKDKSNHLSGFKDGTNSGNDYAYDSNGNMIQDLNKNITTITYNHLNLPTKITFGDGNYIEYLYDATGTKMKKTISNSCGNPETDYLGGFQYLSKPDYCGKPGNPIVGKLLFFPTAEGYYDGETEAYVYNYTDHLGNIRLSYSDDNKDGIISSYSKRITEVEPGCKIPFCNAITYFVFVNEVLEENNYYPFGLKHFGYNENGLNGLKTNNYNHKYNGKELQEEMGLNTYDFSARNYDPATGRWSTIDPLASKYFSSSTYTYGANNPIYFIDPDGKSIDPNNPTDLPEVIITGTRRESSFFFSFNLARTMSYIMPDLNLSTKVSSAYDKFLSNKENKIWYANLHKNDTRDALVVGGVVVGVMLLPVAIEAGTIWAGSEAGAAWIASGQTAVVNVIKEQGGEFAIKWSVDMLAQGIFNKGEMNPYSAAAGASVPWYFSGAASEGMQLFQKTIDGEKITNQDWAGAGLKSFMIAPVGSAVGEALQHSGANKVISEGASSILTTAAGNQTDKDVQKHIK